LRFLPTDEDIPNGVVAFDNEDGETVFVPFCYEIDERVWFFGDPDINYYLVTNDKEFNDIDPHWATMNILFAVSRELYQGVGNGRFAPNAPMNRAMFATVLARLAMVDFDEYTERVFDDVDPDSWYGPAVAWALDKGIVEGMGGSRFNPNGVITRQQMVLMIHRFVEAYELELLDAGDPGAFSDQAAIAPWAADEVTAMRRHRIVTGMDGAFVPQGSSTRAQVATVLNRLVESAIREAVTVYQADSVP